MFERVELSHIHIDESDVQFLEGGLRARSEIAVARADANDQIRIARKDVVTGCSGDADGSQARRIIVIEASLAGEGLSNRYARALNELPQDLRGFAVDHSPA